jgi:purine-nucleoside phosphorylase
MTSIYDKKLQAIIREAAEELDVDLKEGIYAQLTGPSFETPAEIKLLQKLGVDAVGMSTAVEAIAANHCGMKVCGISCVSNLAAGLSSSPLTHEEVQAAAAAIAPVFKKLLSLIIVKMGVEEPSTVS